MLVWTSVHTDTRVLREATSLVAAGYTVHIVGRAVPEHFVPAPGITAESAGRPPLSSGRSRTLTAPERLARWALLPVHVDRRLAAWQAEVRALLARAEPFDVVHAHDFSALPVGAEAARRWGVPLVYDSHELWGGRPTEGRSAPLRNRRDHSREAQLGGQAAAVLTVGDGVATALREAYGWSTIHVVRNTFPFREVPPLPAKVQGLVYAGRLAADRELEVVARASTMVDVPITILGPADEQWLRSFDPEDAQVLPAESLAEIDARLVGAGVALVTHSDRWPNHRLALPNKLFHAVSLGLPVVATDVGELGAIVRAYGLGALYRPGDPAALAAAVTDLEVGYAAHVATVSVARSALSWDYDEQVLRSVYDSLPRTGRQ